MRELFLNLSKTHTKKVQTYVLPLLLEDLASNDATRVITALETITDLALKPESFELISLDILKLIETGNSAVG